MVARLGLLETRKVGVEILRLVERRSVHTRELGLGLVAAPVSTRKRKELYRLDRLRVLEMRPAAQVDEVALRVERDVSLRRVDELDLVRLALLLEALARVVPRDLLALPDAALLDLPLDLVLEPLQVGLRDGLGELEVVVEAVFDRRADRDLRPREEPARGLREEVRGRVAQDVERVGVVLVPRGQDLDPLAVLHRKPQVADAAVRAEQNRLFGELRADRPRRIEARRAVRKFKLGVIGKNDLHHERRGYSGTFAARTGAHGGREPDSRPRGRAGRCGRRSAG